MSVRRRTWRGPDGSPREAFMIDVQIQLPTGEVRRVREVAPVQGRRAAERYEQQIRARLLLGTDEDARESEVHHDSHPTPTISPTPQPTLTPAATIPTAVRGGPRSARRARPTTTPLEGPLASITRPLAPPAATTSTTPTPSASPMLTPTLADFAPRFLEHHRAKGNKPGELRAKDQILTDHLIPAFGALPLDRITARLIDAYKVDKQRPAADTPRPQPKRIRHDRPRKTTRGRAGLAPHTVNNHLTILRSLLHLAARWEMLGRVPAFEMVREDVHDPEFLSFDEARRMVAVAEPEWRIFFITAIGTGLRISELRALRWQDVDLERARIRVARTLTPTGFDVPKSRRPRTVKLGGDVVAALREHPRHPASELVLAREDGEPLTMAQIRGAVERTAKAASIGRPIRPGLLRHTFATHGVMGGVPLNVVQSWMGHSDIRVTLRYAHLAPDIEGDLADQLGSRRQLGAECTTDVRGGAHGTTTAHGRHMKLSDNKTGS
jgi:integrase